MNKHSADNQDNQPEIYIPYNFRNKLTLLINHSVRITFGENLRSIFMAFLTCTLYVFILNGTLRMTRRKNFMNAVAIYAHCGILVAPQYCQAVIAVLI